MAKRKQLHTFVQNMKNLLNARIPLYTFISSMFLLLVFGLLFGWLVQLTEQYGEQKIPLGRSISALSKAPNFILDVSDTIITTFRKFNPKLEGEFVSTRMDKFQYLEIKSNSFELSGPRIYQSENALAGWRIIMGIFQINQTKQSAVLLFDENMRPVHIWPVHEDDIEHLDKSEPDFRFPHGFEVLPDGSILHSFGNGISLKRVNFCGETEWSRIGIYHHTVSLDEDKQTLWTLRHDVGKKDRRQFDSPENRLFEKLDVESGEVLHSFSIADIISTNSNNSVFQVRHQDRSYIWGFDPFHENDVEPLFASFAEKFPQFQAGDLLVSVRNPNLVFVVDPDNKQIKWWRIGMVHRQHDPDWSPTGTFTIFDNNTGRKFSRIVEINPTNMIVTTLIDGSKYNFFTSARGKHQRLPDGSILVTSTAQGRVFEVDTSGNTVFEYLNYFPGETQKTMMLSEARWLPLDFFEFDLLPECP